MTTTTAVETRTMRAIVQDRYGSADVLQGRADEPRPTINDDDVLVRVAAVGVDRGMYHLMTGVPTLMRFIGFGLRRPKVRVPGTNLAGWVEAVGANVTRFEQGDEVYGAARGTFAEYAAVREDHLAPKPLGLTFEQAAVTPHPSFAALQAVRDHGKVEAGQRVLVIGAAGAVGSVATQIAKAFGASVTGVASTRQVDFVRSLGADHVIDYTRDDFVAGERYDVIIDTGGNNSLSRLRSALTPRGTLVLVGGEGGGRFVQRLDRPLRAKLWSLFVGQTARTSSPRRAPRRCSR